MLARVKPKQRKYFTDLRTTVTGLPEVEETIEIDEIRGDWCPAYRVRGTDLAWVHFGEKLWLSIPVEPSFAKKVLQDENLDSQVVDRVKEAEDVGGLSFATLEVSSAEELDQVIPLLRLRHSILSRT